MSPEIPPPSPPRVLKWWAALPSAPRACPPLRLGGEQPLLRPGPSSAGIRRQARASPRLSREHGSAAPAGPRRAAPAGRAYLRRAHIAVPGVALLALAPLPPPPPPLVLSSRPQSPRRPRGRSIDSWICLKEYSIYVRMHFTTVYIFAKIARLAGVYPPGHALKSSAEEERSWNQPLEKPCSPHPCSPQPVLPCIISGGSPRQENFPKKQHSESPTQPPAQLYSCLLLLSDSINAFIHLCAWIISS
ncbi:uncharacterized protein LOC134162087 [Pezoporus occidentalis]|uniref:uncharacterized protein LOC134162087 n=1 Tax=Pezoporus occidentalis TaxID=407982 RepID=UPI002F90EFD2